MEYRTAVDESEGDRQSDRRHEVAPDYWTLVESDLSRRYPMQVAQHLAMVSVFGSDPSGETQ